MSYRRISVSIPAPQWVVVSEQVTCAWLLLTLATWWHVTLWWHVSLWWAAHTASIRWWSTLHSASIWWWSSLHTASVRWWSAASIWWHSTSIGWAAAASWSASHALIAPVFHGLHSECVFEFLVAYSVGCDTIIKKRRRLIWILVCFLLTLDLFGAL